MLAAGATLAALVVALALAGAAHAVPRAFYGVMPQGPLVEDDFDRMGQAKVGTLRFEIFWAGIDPTPLEDDLNWSGVDATVRNAAENGVRPLPFIYSTPPWVTELDEHGCDGGGCVAYAPTGDEALAAWRDFLTATVNRYGPGGDFWAENPDVPERPIRVWQLWNEQNSPSFFRPRPNVKDFATLLDEGHRAITGADPGADIVLGGMFGTPLGGARPGISSWKFLRKLYRVKGAERNFDGVAAHPYASKLNKVIAQVDLLREEMKDAGDRSAKLWITELGWASAGPPSPLNVGRKGQAKKLRESFKYFLKKRKKLKLKTLIWYSWRDNLDADVGLCPWCPFTGLVDSELGAKPSLKAFTNLTGGS